MHNSNFRCTYARIFSTVLLFGLPNKNHAFMETSSFLAWSNAPGASLQEFFGQGLPDRGFQAATDQLTFASRSEPLCPTGASSLTIFDLSESDKRSELNNGFLSSQTITQEFNALPEPSRFWTTHFPISLADRWVAELPSIWSGLCHGQVSVIKVKTGEDLDAAFLKASQEGDQPRLVILTTSPPPLDASSRLIERRGLSENISSSSKPISSEALPDPKTGVFWRYNFLSDYLIVGVLVLILLFIPPVVLGAFALQSIESPKGLKSKMVGQVSEVKGN
ncbi:hypothetical protein PGT21_026774 [Puccinia graminis f. sp. tritici]|uniref:Protein BIG1 n=2 Tax=Puccinia graminis f. sp. tritici TaxID=56615 RepID=E3KQ87_PUCGT|nr:uncharacterized protein PGTG_12418 [Puccinia graminis f. sp. tritici CRL 75-36-700-3]EFP86462.1 hypothetical protein PGTG_12418 [Puccinia graminis f. sp. tritici CRL 75-36-700-3]KAA1096728.1 hypothetical protein PGT21_026774 [Puccinia graminis f. sp. tritici]KAA1131683.1 hypothetical protein PGTUg99_005776 [Puccinia graminis f. sp. tritici]KAA1132544.1 hypothetical protein PGTUg99_015847 [Puccinia graminis f. sp. tritici]